MTNVTFLTSMQGRQAERIEKISAGLREKRPDIKVEILQAEKSQDTFAKFKLKYGPCVMIDGKLAFVGIPGLRQLVEKIDLAARAAANRPAEPAASAAK